MVSLYDYTGVVIGTFASIVASESVDFELLVVEVAAADDSRSRRSALHR